MGREGWGEREEEGEEGGLGEREREGGRESLESSSCYFPIQDVCHW
jgi:hypothetical protein